LKPFQIFTKIHYLLFITGVAPLVEKRQLIKCLNLQMCEGGTLARITQPYPEME
jgi:hypothetical protein